MKIRIRQIGGTEAIWHLGCRLPKSIYAITYSNNVYTSFNGILDDSNFTVLPKYIKIVRHEMKRVAQYEKYGKLGFIWVYFLQWVMSGFDYTNTYFEKEAYKAEILVAKAGVQCIICLDRLFSIERHDFNRCSCSAIAIDGGDDYTKLCFDKIDHMRVIEMTEDDYNNENKRYKKQGYDIKHWDTFSNYTNKLLQKKSKEEFEVTVL